MLASYCRYSQPQTVFFDYMYISMLHILYIIVESTRKVVVKHRIPTVVQQTTHPAFSQTYKKGPVRVKITFPCIIQLRSERR